MKIRCIAIDDEPLALNKLKRNILKFPYLELVASCHNVEQARRYLSSGNIDLVYIDINMPDANGLEFIRTLDNPPMVIFVTAYSEYAVESYKVNALDYILKPYGTEEFARTAEKAYRHWSLLNGASEAEDSPENNVLYLKSEYKYLRVECDDIMFIEGQNEYLKIHLTDGDPFLTHMTFRQISDMLPSCFLQVHRSYIVNMSHVVSADRTLILLEDGTRLPVSSTRKTDLLQYISKMK